MAGRRDYGWPRCSARLRGERAGLFCQMKVAADENGLPLKRCRLHGCSHKARSPEALQRISIAQKSRWLRYRADRAAVDWRTRWAAA